MEGSFTTFVVVFVLILAAWALFTAKNAHHELSWSEFFDWKM